MGIIIKQSIKGSLWSYAGVVIGFVTTTYLFPEYLTTSTVGLFGLLVAWSVLFAQLFSLGFNAVTARMFPHFRDKKNGHNGFLFIAFMVMLVGFGLFLIFYLVFSHRLVENNLEKSGLFSKYIFLLIPLTFFTMLFYRLDTYNRLLYNAVLGTFLVEFFQRFLIIVVVLLYVFNWLSLPELILVYAGVVCAKGVIIFFYLIFRGEINIKPHLQFISKELRKEMFGVAFFGILTGVGAHLIFNIDKIIVNQMLGISATGVYTISSFFGTLILIPSRPLLSISGSLIAEAWKRNDVHYISDIYKRSCINQFIIAAFLFGGIWVNIDNILVILGPEYVSGKWVIFFVGLGTLIDMATGANGVIINYSRYYRVSLWFLLVQVVIFLLAIVLFIPLWNIAGAGAAITVSFLIGNLLRFIFLQRKFNMQPFTYHYWAVILAFFTAYFAGRFSPELSLVFDILVRSIVFVAVYLVIILRLKVSQDVNDTLQKLSVQLKNFF